MRLTQAILTLIGEGVYPTNAARACGITEQTYAYWLAQAQEWGDADPADYPPGEEEKIAAYVAFSSAAARAEALGLAWHEQNVFRAAANGTEQGGRLSLEFLARRMPKVYGRKDRLDVSIGGREPAPVSRQSLDEAREAFEAVGGPPDAPDSTFLPRLPSGDE